jgi:hypothetical protein
MARIDKESGGFSREELSHRRLYIEKIVPWNEQLDAGLRDELEHLPTFELAMLYFRVQQQPFASWILCGSQHLVDRR